MGKERGWGEHHRLCVKFSASCKLTCLRTYCWGVVLVFLESVLGISSRDGGQVSQFDPRGTQIWTAVPDVHQHTHTLEKQAKEDTYGIKCDCSLYLYCISSRVLCSHIISMSQKGSCQFRQQVIGKIGIINSTLFTKNRVDICSKVSTTSSDTYEFRQ